VSRLLRDRRGVLLGGGALCLLLVLVALQLQAPRTRGLQGEWSATALDGPVVAGRAQLSGDHTALDLRTGKTVTLGSVRGGTPYVADDRLLVVGRGRVDSARLDATARWTWRAPAGDSVTPVAAGGGATIVSTCSAKGSCRLVGVDATGRESWSSEGARRRDPPAAGALPRVGVSSLGGGVLVTDPATGRSALQPGRSFVALPDGPVVTEVVQGGSCVIAAYLTADPAWTKVLPTCPLGTPRLSPDRIDSAILTVSWPSETVRLDLATGSLAAPPANRRTGGKVVAHAADLTAIESREPLRTNPFRWGRTVTVLQLVDDRGGEVRGQVVSDASLAVLHLDARSLVVRDGDTIVRYAH